MTENFLGLFFGGVGDLFFHYMSLLVRLQVHNGNYM